jgi:hypothetical protein
VPLRECKQRIAAGGPADDARAGTPANRKNLEWDMHQIIYLVGLIVVILAILSFFGLR